MPTLRAAEKKKYAQAVLTRIGENLYRNESSGSYYGILRRSGKQIKKSLKTKDFALAKRRLRDFEDQLERTTPAPQTVKISFKEMGERWLKTVKPHLKESTYRRRQSSLKNLLPFFGRLNVRQITRRKCEDWASKRAPTCKAATYNIDRETFIAVLQYAMDEGIILDNPAKVIKKRKRGKTDLHIPSLENLQAILKHLRNLDIRYHAAADLIELLAWSGMRKGEANAFLWQDIDWNRGLFTVTGGDVGTKNHEVRQVPIFPTFKAFLKEQRKRLERDFGEVLEDSPVVPNQNAKKALEKACKDLGLPHYNHHAMRHFFVSIAIEKNIDFKTIAAWVGHKDGGVLVAKTYGHLRDTHSMEMAKLMSV